MSLKLPPYPIHEFLLLVLDTIHNAPSSIFRLMIYLSSSFFCMIGHVPPPFFSSVHSLHRLAHHAGAMLQYDLSLEGQHVVLAQAPGLVK